MAPRRYQSIQTADIPTLSAHTGAVFELRANVTAYDVMYVGFAEALRCNLLTADRRLAGAPGTRCTIELLT